MDRIINVKVGGNYLIKDNKNAGVRGEANVTQLRIAFDDGWITDKYAKRVVFWDARGLNPVTVVLTPTMAEDDRTYLVPIPQEPMAEAGKLTFVIEGEIEGKVQRSLSDTLEVKDSPIAPNAGQPIPPTPDDLTRVRESLEEVKGDIIDTLKARDEAVEAKGIAVTARNEAEQFSKSASENAISSAQSCEKAGASANRAWEALGKTAYIGGNGNWWCWDDKEGAFYDAGVKAQAGSTVYVGDNPPEDADVVINPDGDMVSFAPYIGENNNWFVFDMVQEKYVDTGVSAIGIKGTDGYTPVKGVDYFTTEDIETIIAKVRARIKALVKKVTITLLASAWIESGDNQYSQVIDVDATEYSKVDLQPTPEQLAIFYEKDVTFVAENDNGVVTVYCIGQKPTNDYTMQATITEVERNG